MRTFRLLAALALVIGLLAACGNDDDDSVGGAPTGQPSGEPDDGHETNDDGDAGAALGSADATIVVDGTTHGLSEIRRCEAPPIQSGEVEVRETINGLSAEDGTLVLVLQISETPVAETHWVSWRGPEGLFDTWVIGGGTGDWIGDGEIVYDGPIINLDGDRATGSAILADSQTLDPDDRVEITFDVAVPSDLTTC